MIKRERANTQPKSGVQVILFDETSRQGCRAARQSVEKVWLAMCLGSVVTVMFILMVRQVF